MSSGIPTATNCQPPLSWSERGTKFGLEKAVLAADAGGVARVASSSRYSSDACGWRVASGSREAVPLQPRAGDADGHLRVERVPTVWRLLVRVRDL